MMVSTIDELIIELAKEFNGFFTSDNIHLHRKLIVKFTMNITSFISNPEEIITAHIKDDKECIIVRWKTHYLIEFMVKDNKHNCYSCFHRSGENIDRFLCNHDSSELKIINPKLADRPCDCWDSNDKPKIIDNSEPINRTLLEETKSLLDKIK